MNRSAPESLFKKSNHFEAKVVNTKEQFITKEDHSQYSQKLKHLRLFQDIKDRRILKESLDNLVSTFKQNDLIFHHEFFAVVIKKEYLKHRETLQSLTNDFKDLNGVKKILEYSNEIKNIPNRNFDLTEENDRFDLTKAISNYLQVSNKKLSENWTSSLESIKNSNKNYSTNPKSSDSLPSLENPENEDDISTFSPTDVMDLVQRYEYSKKDRPLNP